MPAEEGGREREGERERERERRGAGPRRERAEEEVQETNRTAAAIERRRLFPTVLFSRFILVRLSRSLRVVKAPALDATSEARDRSKRGRERERAEKGGSPFFHSFVDRFAAASRKLTVLRLDGGLDGGDCGVGAELERERAVCQSEWECVLEREGERELVSETGAERDPEQSKSKSQ